MFGLCKYCGQANTGYDWCQFCNSQHFQQNFKNWTSGNQDVDGFIQKTQLKAKVKNEVIEWIDYNKFEHVEYLAKGGYGITYKAYWKNGYIIYWDSKKNRWERSDTIQVVLKSLHNSQDITAEFLKNIESHILMNNAFFIIYCYGITKDPKTNNFMLVMEYAENGNLRTNLDKTFNSMNWWNKLYLLEEIASGLKDIHNKGLIHRNFHCGNILNNIMMSTCISDLGLCQPANHKHMHDSKRQIYGVLPYVAPEVLREKEYTRESDIYGFGIIAHEVVTGFPSFHEVAHDESLAIKICQGLRPRSDYKVPFPILDIISQCLDADPSKRPTAEELYKMLYELRCDTINSGSIIYNQINDVEVFNKALFSSKPTDPLSYKVHPQAIYTSRLLDFENLPEPKNADGSFDKEYPTSH